MNAPDTTTLSRRRFLQGTGALVVGFSLYHPLSAAVAGTAKGPWPTVGKGTLDSWLSIDEAGRVTVFAGKVDLGTGVRTALAQMAADELDVPFDAVTMVTGDTALTPAQGPTWGSLSIQIGGMELRRAAATARRELLARAAEHLGAPVDTLTVSDGMVRRRGGTGGVTYAQLVGGRPLEVDFDPEVPLKAPHELKLIGTSVPRLDIPSKVDGSFRFAHDVRVEGMVHGRVVRPPALGASLQSVDESSVADIPGFIAVVRHGNFLGVVAQSEWAALKASRELKAEWSDWSGLPDMDRLYEHVRGSPVDRVDESKNEGDVEGALAGASRRLEATYTFDINTHGSIGPSCAIADARDGKLDVWCASQATHLLRSQLALAFDLPEEAVRCRYYEGAGCYGRNGHEDAAADAAILSRAVDRPVRVQWSRADEHGWAPLGPPTLVDVRGGLDAAGNLVAWDSEYWVPTFRGELVEFPLLGVTLSRGEHLANMEGPGMIPGNVQNNSEPSYVLPNVRTRLHRLTSTPFRPSWIRSPGRLQNTYANESFFDELAAASGADPVEFRLRYMDNPRAIAVLKAAAEKAGWETRPSPRQDQNDRIARGRGIAYAKYDNRRTYVAAVAEVEVDRETGQVRVTRFVAAQDAGQIINPDGTRNQIEGQIIQTVSRTLKEKIRFDRSRVTSVDWAEYPILTFSEVPDIEMVLIDRPEEPPWGVGEMVTIVVTPAISNAVFDALGVRLRDVPFLPEVVKSEIDAQLA